MITVFGSDHIGYLSFTEIKCSILKYRIHLTLTEGVCHLIILVIFGSQIFKILTVHSPLSYALRQIICFLTGIVRIFLHMSFFIQIISLDQDMLHSYGTRFIITYLRVDVLNYILI